LYWNVRNRVGAGLAMLAGVTLAALLAADRFFVPPRTADAAEPKDDQEADNSMCYVCHLTLQTEEITTIHQGKGYGCTKCHGVSADHMHDEMLMTTPDLLYGRREVDAMCGECHQDPHKGEADKVRDFLEKWRGKERPNGRAITEQSICTDCHGTHNIDKELTTETGEKPPEWQPLFNGQDLAGWRTSGKGDWQVRLGRIVAHPGAEGHADLRTEAEYRDYLMAVTFRADWPLHAGIWLRANDADPGPRVEIFENTKPTAFTGSVGLPGKGLALANLREDLFDPGGWNTLSIEVRGDRVGVWLNGAEIGAMRWAGPETGRIGLHLKGGPAYENGQLAIREILFRRLPNEEGPPP
jgi:hypothetical protein